MAASSKTTAVEMISQDYSIISDLGVVLVGIAIAALVFRILRQPLVFGYVIIGLLLNPNILGDILIQRTETLHALGELGIVFLLFNIGLEFDLRRLQRVIGPATLAVILQTVSMMILGMLIAPILGWDTTYAIFLGSLLAISSSMVTFRTLRDQGRTKHPHAQLAIGILILEDILGVAILVLLTGVAVKGHFAWASVWQVTFFIGVFVFVVYFLGKLVAPPLLNFIYRIGNIEMLTLFTVGIVFGISVLAQVFHFSVALGAFLAGSIFSQSTYVDEIENSTRPMYDVFCAIFFVSIGLLIDLSLLVENLGWIILLSFLVVSGKIASCWLGLFVAGQPSKSSFQAAMVKCQIAEFSFIIAGLGQQLGVTDQKLTTIAVGVALISILLTPVLSAHSEKIHEAMARRAPEPVRIIGHFYHNLLKTLFSVIGKNTLLRLINRPVRQIFIYFFLLNGVVLLSYFIARYVQVQATWGSYKILVYSGIWLLAALLMLPPLVAIIRNLNVIVMLVTEAAFGVGSASQTFQGRMRNIFNNLILLLVLVFSGGIYFSAAARYFPSGLALFLFLGLILSAGIIQWRLMITLNSRIEILFMKNINQRSHDLGGKHRETVMREISSKYPWPVHLKAETVKKGSIASGRRIMDLDLRKQTGCTIIALGRDGNHIFDPSPDAPLFSGDQLLLLGSEKQTEKAVNYISTKVSADASTPFTSFRIEQIYLNPGSELEGNTLAGANLRRRYGINVVGLQRGATRTSSPAADEILQAGDVLLVVGSPTALKDFENRSNPKPP
jgi:CPA2 family monovalent cation:H+ antiporter-2